MIKYVAKLRQQLKYYKRLYRLNNDPVKQYIQKNIELKNIGVGKRAFLLATGPSIKQEDLTQLAGEECFSLSNFFLHDDVQTINPRFHAIAPYHEPMILDNYIAWLREADRTLPPETCIVLGHSTRELVINNKLFTSRNIYYLYLESAAPNNRVDIAGPVLSPQTGPLMLLPLMIYMGYKKIYLLGCDHTILRDYKKNIQNFYDKEKDMRTNALTNWSNIEETLREYSRIFKQYRFYRTILQHQHLDYKIINLSQDSWLELFEFDTLSNVLSNRGDGIDS